MDATSPEVCYFDFNASQTRYDSRTQLSKMRVAQIQKIVDSYRCNLNSLDYKHEALYEYPRNYTDLKDEEHKLAEKFRRSFQSNNTKRLWKRERYKPLELLDKLMTYDAEITNECVSLLFNSNRPIGDRIDSFRFMLGDIIRHYKKIEKHSVISEAEWDMQWISLLLSAKMAEKYAFYHQRLFFRSSQILELNPLPQTDDYERYMKMINILGKFLDKQNLIEKRLQSIEGLKVNSPYKNVAIEALASYAKVDIFAEP